VLAEGRKILNNYDNFADVGRRTASLKHFRVTVSGGKLDLSFRGRKNNALVCAIEITPFTRAPAVPAPLLVNAGGPALVDSARRAFAGDSGFTGGSVSSSSAQISNTPDGPLYSTFRSGDHFIFSEPVANGHYALFLDFAEPTFTQAGQRIFNVTADDSVLLTNFDIVAEAGANQALAKEYDLSISNHKLGLAFDAVVGEAIISGIELVPTDVPAVVMPYSPQCLSPAAQRKDTETDLRLIGRSLGDFANGTRNGRFPPDLATLEWESDLPLDHFANPRAGTLIPRGELAAVEPPAWVASHDDYIYLGAGMNDGSGSTTMPLAYENPSRVAGDISVLFEDLHVETLARADAAALLGFSPADPAHIPPAPDPALCEPDPAVMASEANLSLIGYELEITSTYDPNGRFPADLGALADIQSLPPGLFVNPRGNTRYPDPALSHDQQIAFINATNDYIYLGRNERLSSGSGDTVLAYENPAEMKDGINLLFFDGHVEFREMRWAMETTRASLQPAI
jgi:prepilin-type processing-associated H-X9-DG protein